MLSLRHKVGSKELGVSGFICNYKYLAGACDHINIDLAVKKLLCGGNKNVAGAYYLVNSGNSLCAVCKSSNSLRSAAHEHPVNAYNCRSSKDIGIGLAVLSRRCYHDYLLNACYLCGNSVHKN